MSKTITLRIWNEQEQKVTKTVKVKNVISIIWESKIQKIHFFGNNIEILIIPEIDEVTFNCYPDTVEIIIIRHKEVLKMTKTPFYYKQSGNNIVIFDRKTDFPIFVYSKANTKTNITRGRNLEVYFIHLYHKVIEEKEVTYKFICTLLINYQ